jgi:hypothetical protein
MKAPRIRRALAVLVALGAMTPALPVPAAQAAPVTVTNGTQFTDTTGAPVHAHGGGVVKVGSYYYWFGENRNADNTFRAVSAYRSTDLKTWEFRNHVLTQSSASELAVAYVERPKVLYNSATGQFVLWMHWENGIDYTQARTAVATSSTVDGTYTYVGSSRPLGYESRDMTVFRDDDGSAYLISATASNANLNIYRLTDDYTGVASLVQTLWPGAYREAPAMFKRDGVYFLVTSGATYWSPNQQKYATASRIGGTWTAPANLGDGIGFGSQTAFVLPVQGTSSTSYLYLGDRWAGAWNRPVNESEYVWLPLEFPSATSLTMGWSPQASIDTETGAVQGTGSGKAYYTLAARHSAKCLDVTSASAADGAAAIQYGCNGGANQAWQIRSVDGGYVQLLARHSHKCLDVAGSSTADGTYAVQSTCGTATSQQWRLVQLGSGHYQVIARHSGACLDIAGGATTDSARVLQWPCTGATNQQWTLG